MWIAFALVAAVSEALRGAFGKVAGRTLDSFSMAWGMVAIQGACLFPIILVKGVPALSAGFYVALVCGSILDVLGTVLYMRALKSGDLSIAIPLMSFTPVIALMHSPIINHEIPSVQGLAGVLVVFAGTYVLRLGDRGAGIFGPVLAVVRDPGARSMLAAAALWSLTVSFHKVGIQGSTPWFWPAAYFGWMGVLMTPLMLWKVRGLPTAIVRSWRVMLPVGIFAALMAISQMLALSEGLVVYVASIKNLSALFAVVIGAVVFREAGMRERFFGAGLMVVGSVLIVAA